MPLYLVVSCLVTWPVVAHLPSSLTYGDEPVPTVPRFNLWTMRWNQQQVGDLYRNYWDAPIFHPNDGSFALSEPQPLTGLVFTPIAWLTGNPVLAFNLVFLAIFTLNGYAGARLARRLGVAPAPALLAGVLAVGLSFVANEMGVLQLTAVFPVLFLIGAIVDWAEKGGRWPAALIGIWLAATFLTCGYYGIFAVPGIGLPALALFRRDWLTRSRLKELVVAGAVFTVLALPFLLAQSTITSDYDRSEDLIQSLSANAWEYKQLVDAAQGSGLMPWLADRESGQGLYPGTALLGLAFVGFWLGGPRRQAAPAVDPSAESGQEEPEGTQAATDDAEPSGGGETVKGDETTEPEGTSADQETQAEAAPEEGPADEEIDRTLPRFLLLGAAVAFVLSLGLNVEIFGFQPYQVIRAVVPGYDTLRSPFRFAGLFELFLLGLAAYGLHELWAWRPKPKLERLSRVRFGQRALTFTGPALATLAVVLGVAEVSITPVRLFEVDRSQPDWVEWLAEEAPEPARTGDGSVAFVPFPPGGRAGDYAATTEWMLYALDADVSTVNGYSGFFPEDSVRLRDMMRNYPSTAAEAELEAFGVSYLVVDPEWVAWEPSRGAWLDSQHTLVFSGDALIYEM